MKTLIQLLSRRRVAITAATNHLLIQTRTRTSISTKAKVGSRARDITFEKLMEQYKWLYKVIRVQYLIVGDPSAASAAAATLPLAYLQRLAHSLHLNRGAKQFIYKFPHIFTIFKNNQVKEPQCRLTEFAVEIWNKEQEVIMQELDAVVDRLVRVLSMSITKSVPMRAINKVYRELGMPEDYEDSVILKNKSLFRVEVGLGGVRMLKLVENERRGRLVASVENWRVLQCRDGDGDSKMGESEIRYSFKQGFPPGMKIILGFRRKVMAWQRLEYLGPYELVWRRRNTRMGMKEMEKRAVGIVHEFLSVTVEKMVEVERISHFRKWFGIDLNIRDLFLDHPGIFYLSKKGYTHTVFLREAYERGRLIDPNPVYEVRRKLLDLILLGRHGMINRDPRYIFGEMKELENVESVGNESKLEELESDQSHKDGSEEVKCDLE